MITLGLVPIRLYLLSANDWLTGVLTTLGLAFMMTYFLIGWLWKSVRIQDPPQSDRPDLH